MKEPCEDEAFVDGVWPRARDRPMKVKVKVKASRTTHSTIHETGRVFLLINQREESIYLVVGSGHL